MTAEHESEYYRLIQRLQEYTPIIRQYKLAVPEIPADAGAEH
jgi:hypothetical protein